MRRFDGGEGEGAFVRFEFVMLGRAVGGEDRVAELPARRRTRWIKGFELAAFVLEKEVEVAAFFSEGEAKRDIVLGRDALVVADAPELALLWGPDSQVQGDALCGDPTDFSFGVQRVGGEEAVA